MVEVYRYSGESVGKKLARASFWMRARQWLGERFYDELHIVLASNEGGDISVLKGLGVPPSNILAVDINREAAAECRRKHEDVTVLSGDVSHIAARFGRNRRVACAFLDFCGWGSKRDLDTISTVAINCLDDESVLAYAFMRGREPRAISNEMVGPRLQEKALQDRAMIELRKAGVNVTKEDRIEASDGRSMRWFNAICDDLMRHNMFPMTLCKLYYHSTCSWRVGVPMLISGKWIIKGHSCMSKKTFDKRLREYAKPISEFCMRANTAFVADGGTIRNVDDSQRYFESRTGLCVEIGDRRLQLPIGEHYDREFTRTDNLVRVSCNLETIFPGKSHMILNISKARLAAFKAHVTMGTYKKAS